MLTSHFKVHEKKLMFCDWKKILPIGILGKLPSRNMLWFCFFPMALMHSFEVARIFGAFNILASKQCREGWSIYWYKGRSNVKWRAFQQVQAVNGLPTTVSFNNHCLALYWPTIHSRLADQLVADLCVSAKNTSVSHHTTVGVTLKEITQCITDILGDVQCLCRLRRSHPQDRPKSLVNKWPCYWLVSMDIYDYLCPNGLQLSTTSATKQSHVQTSQHATTSKQRPILSVCAGDGQIVVGEVNGCYGGGGWLA